MVLLMFPIVSHRSKLITIVVGSVVGGVLCIYIIGILCCVGYVKFDDWCKIPKNNYDH